MGTEAPADTQLPEFLVEDDPIALETEIFQAGGLERLVPMGSAQNVHLCRYGLDSQQQRVIYLSAQDSLSRDDRVSRTVIGVLSAEGVRFNDGFTRCAAECKKNQLTAAEKTAIAKAIGAQIIEITKATAAVCAQAGI